MAERKEESVVKEDYTSLPPGKEMSYPGGPESTDVDVKGPGHTHVRLVSNEGDWFYVQREDCETSTTLCRMLTTRGPWSNMMLQDGEAEIHMRLMPTHVLALLCEYLVFTAKADVKGPLRLSLELLLSKNLCTPPPARKPPGLQHPRAQQMRARGH